MWLKEISLASDHYRFGPESQMILVLKDLNSFNIEENWKGLWTDHTDTNGWIWGVSMRWTALLSLAVGLSPLEETGETSQFDEILSQQPRKSFISGR